MATWYMLEPPLELENTMSPGCSWDSGMYCLAAWYCWVEVRGRYLPAASKASRVKPEQS